MPKGTDTGEPNMAFAEIISELSKELNAEIEIEENTCAVRAGVDGQQPVTILLQGFDERRALLTTADLGQPPPERLERLYREILEANDLFRDTGGATLSVNPATGNVRLQRFDPYDAIAQAGASKALMLFANVAAAWAKLVSDYRDAPHEDETNSAKDGNLLGVRV